MNQVKIPHAELIMQLASMSHYTEDGTHWTQVYDWQSMEEYGMIRVSRPIHEYTKIPYDVPYYSYEITKYGWELLEEYREMGII